MPIIITSGYQVLDLSGVEFTTSSGMTKTVPGAWKKLAGANGKLLIVSGLTHDGEVLANMAAWYQLEADSATISTDAGYGIAITDEDSVTLTAPAG